MLKGNPIYSRLSILAFVWICCFGCKAQIEIEGLSSFKKVNIIDKVEYYAVVVGIDRYDFIRQLSYSSISAQKFVTFLRAYDGMRVPREQVISLIDREANKDDILSALQTQFSKADNNDIVIFYFSGHGYSGKIAPRDYLRNKEQSSIKYDEIYDIFKSCEAKHKLWFLDACRDEISMGNENEFVDLRERSEGLAVLFSTSDGRVAIQTPNLGLSVYTYYLVKGLEGSADKNEDNIIDLSELSGYITDETIEHTASRQQPQLYLPEDTSILKMPLIILKNP